MTEPTKTKRASDMTRAKNAGNARNAKSARNNYLLSRKEREKLVRQQDILRAARELFARKGYHNTTLEEIAQHAEFGKGTIYNYFSSKDELLYGIVDQLSREVIALAQEAMAAPGGVREKMTAYAKAMISHARANFDLFHLVVREVDCLLPEGRDDRMKHLRTRVRKVWEIIAKPIAEEISAKKIKPLDAMKLAALFDGMVRCYCLQLFGRFHCLDSGEIDDSVTLVVSVFLDGVAGRKLKG